MKLIKIKTNSEIKDLILYDENDCFIEKYNSKENINFEKLITFLLKQNMTEEIQLENNLSEPSNPEKQLINLFNEVLTEYNKKVEELNNYKASNK